MFSKGLLSRVVKTWDCVVKSQLAFIQRNYFVWRSHVNFKEFAKKSFFDTVVGESFDNQCVICVVIFINVLQEILIYMGKFKLCCL